MKNPEYVSAQSRCLNQCSRPSHDLKDIYPSLQSKDFSDEKVAAILTVPHTSSKDDNVSQGIFIKSLVLKTFLIISGAKFISLL